MTDQLPDQGTPKVTEHENVDYLSQLVGEDKKYKNIDELAKGALHANQFIETLKAENAEKDEKIATMQSQEDHLKTIMEALNPLDTPEIKEEEPKPVDPVVEEPQAQEPNIDINAALMAQEFAKLGEAKYGDFETTKAKLLEYVGDDEAKRSLATTMMSTDPGALIKILPDPVVPNEGTITGKTSMTTQSNVNLPLTQTQADEVLRKDPKRYRSEEFQAKIRDAWEKAEAAGIKFNET